MAVFTTADQGREVLREVFTASLADTDFATRLKERELSLQFVVGEPDFELFVSSDGVVDQAPYTPVLRFELTADTLHAVLLGKVSIPLAVIERRLLLKGPVARVRELADVLPTVGANYGRQLAARAAAPAAA